MKKSLFSLLALIILFSACKKEQSQKIANSPTSQNSIPKSKSIPGAAIKAWFVTHKVGDYLVPDWTKAEQTTV